MYKVIVTTNDSANKTITVILSERQYERIIEGSNVGGFKRYDVELYSDNEPKQKSDIIAIMQFLSSYVFYCTLSELQSFL